MYCITPKAGVFEPSIVLAEFSRILRGNHPACRGNRFVEAQSFLERLNKDRPKESKELALTLAEQAESFSVKTGLSADRIIWAAERLRYGRRPPASYLSNTIH